MKLLGSLLFAAAVKAEGMMEPMGDHGAMDGHGDMGEHDMDALEELVEEATTAEPHATMEATTAHHMEHMTYPDDYHEEHHEEHEKEHHEEEHEDEHHDVHVPACNSCGCNAAEMAQWKESMAAWKHDHNKWMYEFKAWQAEYGDADIDWEEHDDKDDYDDHEEPQIQPAGDLSWIFDFLGNEDMICPMFNFLIDPTWGLGTGEDWENGCRANVQVTNQWMALFNGAPQDPTEMAEATCGMLLSSLDALVPGANMAGEMCKCLMGNILRVGITGNVDMSMLNGALECVNISQQFIGGLLQGGDMDEDHHGSGDHHEDHDEDHDMEDHAE